MTRTLLHCCGELGDGDLLPAGPYTVGLTVTQSGYIGIPYLVRCGDGRAVAGHVASRDIAEAIAEALNAHFPVAP